MTDLEINTTVGTELFLEREQLRNWEMVLCAMAALATADFEVMPADGLEALHDPDALAQNKRQQDACTPSNPLRIPLQSGGR
jgi:hypothetical protein